MAEGMKAFKLFPFLQSHPGIAFTLLHSSAKVPLTADSLLDIFTIAYDFVGSNLRDRKEKLWLNWSDFIKKVESGGIWLAQSLQSYVNSARRCENQ